MVGGVLSDPSDTADDVRQPGSGLCDAAVYGTEERDGSVELRGEGRNRQEGEGEREGEGEAKAVLLVSS